MHVAVDTLFRANPGYELVLGDRLAAAERATVLGDASMYGVLRPRHGTSLSPRAVSADTALLFMTLGEPGTVPGYARSALAEGNGAALARLIADDVLEVQRDGAFVSGIRATEPSPFGESDGGSGRIGELSRAALTYAESLVGLSDEEVAMRIYCYGRRPATAAVRRLDERSLCDSAVSRTGWIPEPLSESRRAHWRSWRPRGGGPAAPVAYKLYVSPALEDVETALSAVAETLAAIPGVISFKLGVGAEGLCRPDKLVAYFERLDDLREAAARLTPALDGCSAQPVPFTAAITNDGLLSWGADPPALKEATSWRMWVAQRLAEYLGDAARTPADGDGNGDGDRDVAPWRHALARLRLAGIDTATWTPAGGMWERALQWS
jgi:hypothetical protein